MTGNILSNRLATRRKLLKFGAAASALPWVHIRSAGAAGQVTFFTWDHWVPAGNVELKKQIAAFADKNKVEVKADFITSQGNQTVLTLNAEAQAKVGHDAIIVNGFNTQHVAHLLEPVDDVAGRLIAKYGTANPVSEYVGKYKGKWIAVPTSWGSANLGPVARISIMKEAAGIDVVKMYPAANVPETPEAKAWTYDAFLKAAAACHKAGKPFGIGIGTTGDSVNTAGSIFAAYGAELVDAAGKIQIKSDAVRQALEYAQKLVVFLPPEAQSWDDASNNRAFIAGQCSMIWNPPSAWAVAMRDAPAVAADTWHFPSPVGPKGRFVPASQNFWGIWQFAKNKSAAKDLIEYLMQIENVDARSTAVQGFDLPPFQKMAESSVWDRIGPPVGSVYNYPVRQQHNALEHLAHMPAPPEIAVQIVNRGTLPTMFAKLKAGQTIAQVIAWGNGELEGFVR